MVVVGEGEVKDYPPHLCPLPQGERKIEYKKFLMGGGYESSETGGSSDFCFPFGSPGCGKSAASIDEPFTLEDS